jgi:hypothetical protein
MRFLNRVWYFAWQSPKTTKSYVAGHRLLQIASATFLVHITESVY